MAKTNKSKSNADVTRAVVLALKQRDPEGVARPSALVEEARNPKHPLHTRFEWDDRVAGEKHRIDQAREIISSVVFEVEHRGTLVPVHAFVRSPRADPKEQGYLDVREMSEEDRLKAMWYEVRQIEALLARAENIAIAFGLEEEMREVRASVSKLRSRVSARALAV